MNRFSYVKYDEVATIKQATLKNLFEKVESYVVASLPDGRARALCLTALEEAYMWTGKAIRDEQIARTGRVDEQPERNNE